MFLSSSCLCALTSHCSPNWANHFRFYVIKTNNKWMLPEFFSRSCICIQSVDSCGSCFIACRQSTVNEFWQIEWNMKCASSSSKMAAMSMSRVCRHRNRKDEWGEGTKSAKKKRERAWEGMEMSEANTKIRKPWKNAQATCILFAQKEHNW